MFNCKCGYLYNITKNVKNKQLGGKVSNDVDLLFEKFKSGKKLEEDDIKSLTSDDLKDDPRFDAMTIKERSRLVASINAVDKTFLNPKEDEEESANIAYFICKRCKRYEPIKAGTIIYTKPYNSQQTDDSIDYSNYIHDVTLPRTKVYVCKNSECETHKNPKKKEAVFTKNTMDQIIYICTTCSTHWIASS